MANLFKKICTDLKIRQVIKKFEKNNNLIISNYVSNNNYYEHNKFYDNYIGSDIFKKNIENWINSFTDNDKSIFYKLLMNYKYFTENSLKEILFSMINEITNSVKNFDKVYFITFPSKDGIKSGGDDIRSLLGLVGLNSIQKDKIISNVEYKKKEIIENAEAIVILEDIVGSGLTLYSNINNIIDILELKDNKNIKIYLRLIAGRERKVKEKVSQLEKKNNIKIDYSIYFKCKKCFDEMHIFDNNNQKYKSIVEKYEEQIDKTKRGEKKSNVLGFMANQFLISFVYNTPNNTLCNFWEPSENNSPLFIRTSYKRPNINDIKNAKKRNTKKAYILGRIIKKYEEKNFPKNR